MQIRKLSLNLTLYGAAMKRMQFVKKLKKNQYDLVVKYTKDEESFTSLIFTPVDWQLLRKCPIPVLMVRDGDWKHQRRILVAVNVSGEQEYQMNLTKS